MICLLVAQGNLFVICPSASSMEFSRRHHDWSLEKTYLALYGGLHWSHHLFMYSLLQILSHAW
jgi:hypothetical protein